MRTISADRIGAQLAVFVCGDGDFPAPHRWTAALDEYNSSARLDYMAWRRICHAGVETVEQRR